MAEQTLGVPTRTPRLARMRCVAAQVARGLELRPSTSWAVAALIVAVLMHRFWVDEGSLANILFTAAVTFALIALVVLLSRRVLFATVLVASLVAVIVVAASVKRSVMNMVVHAYDLIFYLSSWSTVSYLWSDQRRYLVGFVGALLISAALAWLAYASDGTRVRRPWATAALLVWAALGWVGADLKGERRHMQFYYDNLYVSSFYASWGETLETLWRGALLEAAPH